MEDQHKAVLAVDQPGQAIRHVSTKQAKISNRLVLNLHKQVSGVTRKEALIFQPDLIFQSMFSNGTSAALVKESRIDIRRVSTTASSLPQQRSSQEGCSREVWYSKPRLPTSAYSALREL